VTALPANIALTESDIRTSLADMLAAIPARPQPSIGAIDTRHLMATLARQWPRADDSSRQVLNQFARRLAISKQLDEGYTAQWRREAPSRGLVARDHYGAAAVLLAFAFALDDGIGSHGESLHLVNGALFARDRSADVEPAELVRFDALCAHLIAGRIHG
jgi:hypothetical protein